MRIIESSTGTSPVQIIKGGEYDLNVFPKTVITNLIKDGNENEDKSVGNASGPCANNCSLSCNRPQFAIQPLFPKESGQSHRYL